MIVPLSIVCVDAFNGDGEIKFPRFRRFRVEQHVGVKIGELTGNSRKDMVYFKSDFRMICINCPLECKRVV